MHMAAARRVLARTFLGVTSCAAALSVVGAQQSAPQNPSSKPTQTPASEQTLPLYRARVLGVYDERSGDPIDGATVSDFLSRASALTNGAGLVSLVFLPDGGSLVRIQKLGYEPQRRLLHRRFDAA